MFICQSDGVRYYLYCKTLFTRYCRESRSESKDKGVSAHVMKVYCAVEVKFHLFLNTTQDGDVSLGSSRRRFTLRKGKKIIL